MPFIGKLIYGVYSEKSELERLQATFREAEWQAIVSYIPKGASFLDVDCGAGYAMQRALEEKQCTVVGIDPEPGAHGVGRY